MVLVLRKELEYKVEKLNRSRAEDQKQVWASSLWIKPGLLEGGGLIEDLR